MDIVVCGHEYFYDITSLSMLFFPGEKISYVKSSRKNVYARSALKIKDDKYISISKIKLDGKFYISQKTAALNCDTKDLVKFTFYNACKKATGINSPWGILTGIRPLSVYEKILKTKRNPEIILKKEYLLTSEKIDVLSKISQCQHSVISNGERDVSVYISIPFCPTKCTYCSFISVAAVNKRDLQEKYISYLIEEIRLKSDIIKKHKLYVRSLYIGGGTPGILTQNQLVLLLKTLKQCFNINEIYEKCFEIGRPDTVNDEKLKILYDFGFDRICINTQTTNDSILKKVNRNHSSKEYFDAVKMAKEQGFKIINTDIIAGLPGESVDSFKETVDEVIETGVENITIHTLAIKKSAKLAESDKYYNPHNPDVDKMIEYSYARLQNSGYIPYYIYRQKNCVSNAENVGFCKPDKVCLYNIYMMEDIHSVIACGAGASTKIIDNTTVNRIINVKYPMDYVSDFDKIKINANKTELLLNAVFQND